MLQAYLDSSGTTPNDGIAVVAAIVATADKWEHFVNEWKAFLSEVELSRWHNTDFHAHRNEYARWHDGDAKSLMSMRRISEILNALRPLSMVTAVKYDDWGATRLSHSTPENETAIGFCLDCCLEGLIHRLREIPQDEGIAIYIDNDENQDIAKEVNDWHMAYYRDNDETIGPDRDINLTFGSNRQFIPLQAADILANETFKYAHSVVAGNPVEMPIIERIRDNNYLIFNVLFKEGLEMQLDLRAHGAIRPDGRNVELIERYVRLRRNGV